MTTAIRHRRHLRHSYRRNGFARPLLGLALSLALIAGGCSSGSGPRGQTATRFEPTILADGTKLFTYTVDLAPRAPREGERLGNSDRPVRLDGLIDELLAENGYCREGWLVIDHYQTLRSVRARGECREAASAADRERYSR